MQLYSDYLMSLISPLLHKPEEASVVASQDELGVLLTIHVDTEDMGVVIGRKGETAQALRHLSRIHGMKHMARVSVKIDEPPNSTYHKERVQELPANLGT